MQSAVEAREDDDDVSGTGHATRRPERFQSNAPLAPSCIVCVVRVSTHTHTHCCCSCCCGARKMKVGWLVWLGDMLVFGVMYYIVVFATHINRTGKHLGSPIVESFENVANVVVFQ